MGGRCVCVGGGTEWQTELCNALSDLFVYCCNVSCVAL